LQTLNKTFLDSPLVFFAFIMLTEPLTTPPTKLLQSFYGGLVGFLFAPQLRLGVLYTTPEIALLLGNIFSYIVSPKGKQLLKLKEKIQIGPNLFDFIFSSDGGVAFSPGQYMEWTLPHKGSDSRGNRRYFTVASSPTEEEIHLGVKFYDRSSSFKKNLLEMEPGQKMLVGQLSGDFTLPEDKNKKLVLVAGGIGITPFRSMIKYLIDKGEKRDVVLFYSNRTPDEIAYKELFERAQSSLGLKVVYVLTGNGEKITPELIKQEAPDYKDRIFYLSGPRSMVLAFEKALKTAEIPSGQIKIDYFPGFA
jgi:glycine betaine catabolism B